MFRPIFYWKNIGARITNSSVFIKSLRYNIFKKKIVFYFTNYAKVRVYKFIEFFVTFGYIMWASKAHLVPAKSNRATCRQCEKKIKKGELKFSTWCSGPFHVECIRKTNTVIESSSLRGMKRKMVEIIENAFDQKAMPVRKKSRTRKFRVSKQMMKTVLEQNMSKLKQLDKMELLALCHYNDLNIFTLTENKMMVGAFEISIEQMLWSLHKGIPKRCSQCGGQHTVVQRITRGSGRETVWVCSGILQGSILKTHVKDRYRTKPCNEIVGPMMWPTKFEMQYSARVCKLKTQSALLEFTCEDQEFSEATVEEILQFLPFYPYFFEFFRFDFENALQP